MKTANKANNKKIQESKACQAYITKHVSAIMAALQKIAQGDFTQKIKVSSSKDIFSKLFTAVNLTIDSLERTQTEKKKIAEKLQALSQRQQALLAAIPDIVMEVDKDKVYTWANQAGIKFFGKEVVGKTAAFYFEGKQKTYQVVEPLFHGDDNVFYVESWQRRQDGQKRLLAWWSHVLKDENGNVIGAISTARDITERKKNEQVLEKHTKELKDVKTALLNVTDDLNNEKDKLEKEKIKDETILSCLGEGLFVVDLKGRTVLINKAFENLLGWKATEIQDQIFVDLVQAQDSDGKLIPAHKRPISVAISQGKEVTNFGTNDDYCLVKKDKTKLPICYKVTLMTLEKKIIGAVGVFRDITKEREIDREKTEFVSIASHQLRTPLGITKWYLEAIKTEDCFKSAPKTTLAYLDEIDKNTERLISLVHNLLSVSHIDQKSIRNDPQKIDLRKLIESILETMNLIATTKKIKLNLVIKPKSLPAVFIDPIRLREAIENLVINAIEYNIPSGNVKVVVDKKIPKMFSISVQDTGVGLSEEDQKKLFTKFFRSESAVAQNPNGSGLGLYVVKSYIEDWDGKISVKSKKGIGSVFTITIPLKQQRAERK